MALSRGREGFLQPLTMQWGVPPLVGRTVEVGDLLLPVDGTVRRSSAR